MQWTVTVVLALFVAVTGAWDVPCPVSNASAGFNYTQFVGRWVVMESYEDPGSENSGNASICSSSDLSLDPEQRMRVETVVVNAETKHVIDNATFTVENVDGKLRNIDTDVSTLPQYIVSFEQGKYFTMAKCEAHEGQTDLKLVSITTRRRKDQTLDAAALEQIHAKIKAILNVQDLQVISDYDTTC